jgi:nucleotide-binding universal stress UspA family protein
MAAELLINVQTAPIVREGLVHSRRTVMPRVAKAVACEDEIFGPSPVPTPGEVPALRFRHILVPTDLTSRTDKVLDMASHLAGVDDSRITLLHVIETIDGLPAADVGPFYEHLERKARVSMKRFEGRTWKDGVRCETAIVYGKRSEAIVKFAATHRVDLIVLASHKVNPATVNRDCATISYKTGILAPCPVLLVK